MSGIQILLSDRHGVYIPREFVNRFDGWKNISDDDIEILNDGIDGNSYWDAWDNVIQKAEYVDAKGHIWHLYQDGDLFAICEELMTDEEKESFFGNLS
jgi:hypothetical protein